MNKFIILLMMFGSVYSQCLGDMNDDDTKDILDIVLMVDIIFDGEYDSIADINEDNIVDILDIVLLVNIILDGDDECVGCCMESSSYNIETLNCETLCSEEGMFTDYFYDLDSDFNAKFFYYQIEGPVANTILNPSLFNPNRDTLNIRTFSNFILKVEPEDLSDQTSVSVFDETTDGCSMISETCPDIDGDGDISNTNIFDNIPQVDSLIIYSHVFSSILSLEWDVEVNRYRTRLEDYEYEIDGTSYISQWLQGFEQVWVDTSLHSYDSLIYMTVLDTILTIPEGQIYFDQSEYIKRDSVYTVSDIELSYTFNFTRNILSSDSLMYRVNTDCNLDGVWSASENKLFDYNNDGDSLDVIYEFNDINSNGTLDDGEMIIFDYNTDGDMEDILFEFDDIGNGNIDISEIYWDSNYNGVRDLFEPFEDLNCNGVWDDAETYYDEFLNQSDCEESSLPLIWDFDNAQCFEDRGNGQWDGDEHFENNNPENLYELVSTPVNLLVDYTDPDSPMAIPVITASTSVTLRGTGETYFPISPEDIIDVVVNTVPKVDSVRTTFSNKVISQITNSTLYNREYKILKSQFPNAYSNRNYSYTVLDDNEDHVVELHYPS